MKSSNWISAGLVLAVLSPCILAAPGEAPGFETLCQISNPDRAWLGMPYERSLGVSGSPLPEVSVKAGPPGLAYDSLRQVVTGWTPDSFGEVTIQLEAANASGSDVIEWKVEVESSSSNHDEEFSSDPRENGGFWELYEPQTGIEYSIVDGENGSSWWRLSVPQAGDQGLNFDTWTSVDRAPQLRTPIDENQDFLIETRVRLEPDPAPPAGDEFLSGLLIYFSTFDIIHWNIGQERLILGNPTNLFLERSGQNDLAHGRVEGLLQGAAVDLRAERSCDTYRFFYRADGDETWTLAGTYVTADQPTHVGLVMKTWGDGATFVTDFDYFGFVQPGPRASFTVAPTEGIDPLPIQVDGSASSSRTGAITRYEWDFGDGKSATGAVQSHTYTAPGDFNVTLTVTDATGNKGEASRRVTVDFRSENVSPWQAADIGEPPPAVEGGQRLEGAGCLRIHAGGKDIAARSDQFHFVYQPLTGDGSLVARLASTDWTPGSKIGVMLREDLSPGSRFGMTFFNNLATSAKYSMLRREQPDAATKVVKNSVESVTLPNAWVRIERSGGEVIGSWSADGAAWIELTRGPVPFGETILAGIAASSRDSREIGIDFEALLCDVRLESGTSGEPRFHRGDVDDNGVLQLTDAIRVLGFLFLGGDAPGCLDSADADDNGVLQLTDAVRILGFLFLGNVPPAPPGPPPAECGTDPAGTAPLGCAGYSSC